MCEATISVINFVMIVRFWRKYLLIAPVDQPVYQQKLARFQDFLKI